MTIAASSGALSGIATPPPAATPALTLADALGGLTRAIEQLQSAISMLAASQATAGAGALGGGAGAPGSSGCACAHAGAAHVGQAPPVIQLSGAAGAAGAPPAAPKRAAKQDAPDKVDAAGGGSSAGARIVAEARTHLGKPYVYGAAGPGTFDCSGLTSYVLKQLGIKVPRTASQQMNSSDGQKISSKADLQPGDLVFFNGGGHTGIYIGDGQYIHAPKPGDKVKIGNLSDSWATANYEFGRRFH